MDNTKQVIWITGASSGIGEALVYEYAKQSGLHLILSARRESELQRVASNINVPYTIIPFDLTDSDQISAAVERAEHEVGRVDVLVNNGGVSTRAMVAETSVEVDRRIMEINYFGHIILTKAVLPLMLRQGKGHFIVISSVAGKFGFPQRSAYSAAKHALHGFYETLGFELEAKGIEVTLVNPGGVKTQISVNALSADGTPHGEMDALQAEGMSAEECAMRIVNAAGKYRREVNIGGKEVMLVYVKRYAPWLFRRIVRNVSKKNSA